MHINSAGSLVVSAFEPRSTNEVYHLINCIAPLWEKPLPQDQFAYMVRRRFSLRTITGMDIARVSNLLTYNTRECVDLLTWMMQNGLRIESCPDNLLYRWRSVRR